MEEKILIQSERWNFKRIYFIIGIIGLFAALIALATVLFDLRDIRVEYDTKIDALKGAGGYVAEQIKWLQDKKSSLIAQHFSMRWFEPLIPIAIAFILCVVVYILFWKTALVVTNLRVYGTTTLGIQVDIPVDSISAASKTVLLRGVTVASSSGKITFLMLDNAAEIYSVIISLLHERQSKAVKPAETAPKAVVSNADEIKKYKELLDCGAITQEEFDIKKKQLLGL
jgi:hypothetical protein